MSVPSLPCDVAEISVRWPFCPHIFETLPQNLLEMQILPHPNFLHQKFWLKHSHLTTNSLRLHSPRLCPGCSGGRLYQIVSLSFGKYLCLNLLPPLWIWCFFLPQETLPLEIFGSEGTGIILMDLVLKWRSTFGKLTKTGGGGWRTDLTFHKTFLLIKSLRL